LKRQNQQLKKRAVSCYRVAAAMILFMAMTMSCSRTTHIAKVEVTHSSIHEMDEDAQITAMIQPYKELMDAEMGVVIGINARTLEKGKPESTLGNWVADLLVERTSARYGQKVDFAIQNYGGLRINTLGAGDITVGRLYELMPFDNIIVVLHMKGEDLMQMFDHMARSRGWPISGQVRYAISDGQAVDVQIDGKPLESDHMYVFALPDYIANGGDKCTFLANAEKREDLDYSVRDAIIDQVRMLTKEGREIEGELDGRVRVIGNR
jgi:2',3'-cyclic-nucleotide 2'-phosphodiesterase (5'-nucleotidase family)